MKTNVRKIITTGLLVCFLPLFLVGYSRFKVSSLFWAPYADEAAVLLYHQIAPAPGGPYSITPQLFREHLDALLKNGYHVISTDELTGFLEGKAPLPEKAVAITFDDGYRSFYRYAYPELKSRGLPATDFIITSWTGKKIGGLEYLTWNEMREMQTNGMSFYAHTDHSHNAAPTDPDGNSKPVLTNRIWLPRKNRLETQEEYRRRVTDDLSAAKNALEKELHRPVTQIAWPYGDYNETLIRVARSLGYRFGYTTQPSLVTAKTMPFAIPRLDVGNPNVTPADLIWRIQAAAFKEKLALSSGLRFWNDLYSRTKNLVLGLICTARAKKQGKVILSTGGNLSWQTLFPQGKSCR
jgi:biofilm PGA synthesis lipoprotein PgaB